MASSIYDFTVKDQQGNDVSLADYRGRVLLVVNTATECGFTPTYAQLEALYTTLHERGLDILDFPCDQFGHQAPGTNEEIARFCTSRFGVTFPQFAKIEVNGEGADPLFAYLQQQKGFEGFDEGHELTPVLEDLLAKDDPDYAGKPDTSGTSRSSSSTARATSCAASSPPRPSPTSWRPPWRSCCSLFGPDPPRASA